MTDKLELKPINVSLTGSLAIYGSNFNYILCTDLGVFVFVFNENKIDFFFPAKFPFVIKTRQP